MDNSTHLLLILAKQEIGNEFPPPSSKSSYTIDSTTQSPAPLQGNFGRGDNRILLSETKG